MPSIKTIFTNINASFSLTQGSPPFQKLDFGLFSAVFLSPRSNFQTAQRFPTPKSRDFRLPEPAIPFSNCSVVSPSKTRDFRLPEPAIPFSNCSAVSPSKTRDFRLPEPAIPFSNCSVVSPSKTRDFRLPEPAIPFSNCSAVSPSKTRDFQLPEPAIPFSNCSAVSPSKTRDFRLPEPAIPLATHGQRLHFRLATTENQSEASIGSHLSPLYYSLQYSQIQEVNKHLELNKPVPMYVVSKNHLQLCISITFVLRNANVRSFLKSS